MLYRLHTVWRVFLRNAVSIRTLLIISLVLFIPEGYQIALRCVHTDCFTLSVTIEKNEL